MRPETDVEESELPRAARTKAETKDEVVRLLDEARQMQDRCKCNELIEIATARVRDL